MCHVDLRSAYTYFRELLLPYVSLAEEALSSRWQVRLIRNGNANAERLNRLRNPQFSSRLFSLNRTLLRPREACHGTESVQLVTFAPNLVQVIYSTTAIQRPALTRGYGTRCPFCAAG